MIINSIKSYFKKYVRHFIKNSFVSIKKCLLKYLNVFIFIWWFLWIVSSVVTIWSVLPQLSNISSQVKSIQYNMISNDSENIIRLYYFYIEQWKIDLAYDLLTENVQKSNNYYDYKKWLNDTKAFEGFTISELKDKTSVSSKYYIVHFSHKFVWKKPVDTYMLFTVLHTWKTWKINWMTPLKENDKIKDWACEYYNFPECEDN